MMGENLEFKFKNSANGLHNFNFIEESGHLVGLMGGSGVGKSTLMNLLNGKINPTRGKVSINGYTTQKASAEGVVGYVPQDDLLFEELTVYQNLYFNAKICFSDFSETRIIETVNKILDDLDLGDTSDLTVGDPLNKSISGGQRKRLNIALELMREPAILFVDEPTSGLSSMDSEKVMLMLKNLARSGKLVFCIIHQPSSDIFKLFDRLWILDKGGYPIYAGNPVDAVVYFKTMSTQVNAAESECTKCGNVIPEQILQIIEAKEISGAGKITTRRRVKPQEWYEKYKQNIESKLKRVHFVERLPPSNFHIPGILGQFLVFSKRNLLSKLSNSQYILISLLQAPILALILSYFSKYSPVGDYTLAGNKNLPVYLFMAVVVALFTGMTVSAEEIFKDQKILARESFLNLSRWSYLNAKIFYLFVLSAFQTLSFVVVGDLVLEMQGLTLLHWIILFSTACFANMLGLNISSAFNSIITIYILIPFILVPQLLLGGAMIKFDELQRNIAKQEFVPWVGDIMASRWAYEALTVSQFKHNDYQKHFFKAEKAASQASFQRAYVIPQLEALTQRIIRDSARYEVYADDFAIIKNEITRLEQSYGVGSFIYFNALTPENFSTKIGRRLLQYLGNLRSTFQSSYWAAIQRKDSIYGVLVKQMGKDALLNLKATSHNESVSDLVLNKIDFENLITVDDHFVQKKDPIFKKAPTSYGRAHFYASEKRFGSVKVDTVLFNVIVLWLMSGFLYLTLIDNTLKKFLVFLERITSRNKA